MNAITKPQKHTTHADAASGALRSSLVDANSPLRSAVSAYRTAWTELSASTDLLEVMRSAGSLVLAAEAITAAAKHAESVARTALAEAMHETGCPAVTLPHHTVHLGTKAGTVAIDDEQLLPAELMRQPPPAPDRVAIAKLLRAGIDVPGARLIGNREPIVQFRTRHFP